MQQLKFQQSGESCVLYSAAMCLEVTPRQLAELIGHDGTEVLYPEMASPYCYRGITLVEVNDAIRKFGLHFGTVISRPVAQTGDHTREVFEDYVERYEYALHSQVGIVVGILESGVMHAIAKDAIGNFYDPLSKPMEIQAAYFHPLCSTHSDLRYLKNYTLRN